MVAFFLLCWFLVILGTFGHWPISQVGSLHSFATLLEVCIHLSNSSRPALCGHVSQDASVALLTGQVLCVCINEAELGAAKVRPRNVQ